MEEKKIYYAQRARQSAPAPDCPKAYRSQYSERVNLNRLLSPQGLVSPTRSLNLNRSLSPFLLLCCTILTFSCSNTDQDSSENATERTSPEITLKLHPSDNNPRNSEGDFIQLNDGRVMFVYSRFYGDSRSDFGSSSLAARFSDDGGDTWTHEDITVVPNEGNVNVMSVSLLRLKGGEIALFYLRKNSMWDCLPTMRISEDEGHSWSAPRTCITDREGYYVLNNDRVIQLASGRLLMPVALHITPEQSKRFNENGTLYCYYSDDHGLTWTGGAEIENPTGFMTQEPGVVELKDGRVMMFIRSDAGRQLVSYSSNAGETWSPVQLSNIVSPLAPASIERIPSTGDLLLVWNFNDETDVRIKGKRTPFNTAISRDDGQTWTNIQTIAADMDTRYCYTSICFVNDQVLLGHVAGQYSNGTRNSITHITKLGLDWIYQSSETKM